MSASLWNMAAREGGPVDIKKAGVSECFGSHVNTLDTETLEQLLTMLDGGFSGVERQIYRYSDDLKFLRLVIVTGNFNRAHPSFVRLISIDRRCNSRAIIEDQPGNWIAGVLSRLYRLRPQSQEDAIAFELLRPACCTERGRAIGNASLLS